VAEGVGINGTNGVQSALPGGTGSSSQAAESAASLPKAPQASQRPAAPGVAQPTTYASDPAVASPAHSKVVARLLEQNATVYAPGLARVPLPARPDGTPRAQPKKPAGPMVAPRELEGGHSPLAPGSLQDARGSADSIGAQVDTGGEGEVLANAQEGARLMPSRHGLVAYGKTSRGDNVYLTQERWLHIRENHMDPAPQPRGKRTTTYWPTSHAVEGPSMTDQQVVGVIMDTVRKGTLRTEVRDTRMAEYDLPTPQREAYGVSEAKVSMAPDGLVLSAYPGAGDNVLAVYETTPEDHAALAQATGGSAAPAASSGDERMFRTNIATTSFG
jgi:hypothetical protein